MDHPDRHQTNKKRYSNGAMAAIAVSFLLTGVIITSGLNATPPSLAKEVPLTTPKQEVSVAAVPSSFAQLAKSLSPSVVNVRVTKVEKTVFQGQHGPEGYFGDFFDQFFKEMPQMPRNHRTQGAGSGVIIDEDGTILTNNHVVEGAREVTVTLDDKREFEASVVGVDPKTDLAVLKIDTQEPLPVAAMANSDQIQVGDWVMAIGNPFGLNHTVTSGIVSAKGRVIGAGPYDDFIQTDASINPGNSGGPLFNMKGEIVGINTAIIPNGQGIGFAIPINTAKPLIPQLVNNGEVTRGYLGVNIQSITPELAEALELEIRKGALVGDVQPDSPAEEGGIKRGDIIVAYNGKQIGDSHDLPPIVAATKVGEKAKVTILRNGKEKNLSIKVGKLQSDESIRELAKPAKKKWGMQLQNITPQIAQQLRLDVEKGVVVAGVESGSPAHEAGVRQGDIIVEVNRKPVDSAKGVVDQVAKNDDDTLLLLVQRDKATFFVPLEHKG